MSNFLYFPTIKTRDAELRCFYHINESDFAKILPIYELTKSRKTKKAPDGDIYQRMKKISEIQGDKPFILDLSTDSRYINPQIEQLLSEQNGFREWQYFLFDLHAGLNIVPMVHLHEDENNEFDDVKEFVRFASSKVDNIAVRLPYDLDKSEVEYYLNPIAESVGDTCKVYVIFDAGFVRDKKIDDVVSIFSRAISGVKCFESKIEDVIMLCTTFPSNVAQEGGEDIAGSFEIYEEEIYQKLKDKHPVKYGDYASINTEQIEIKGGTFVPRIDIALLDGKTFDYKRYRRNNGGYVRCARHTLEYYKPLDVWADEEIKLAANENPSGISPSFWISVRMNYYMKTRIMLRE